MFFGFRHSDFFRISDFGFRISLPGDFRKRVQLAALLHESNQVPQIRWGQANLQSLGHQG